MRPIITFSLFIAAAYGLSAANTQFIPDSCIQHVYNPMQSTSSIRITNNIPEVASGTYFLNTVENNITKGIPFEIINNGNNSYTLKHFAFQAFHDLPASVVYCTRPGVETYTLSIPSGSPCYTSDGTVFGIYMGVPNADTGKWNIYDNDIDFIVDSNDMTYIFAPYGGTIMYYAAGIGGIKIADLVNGILVPNGSMTTLELRDDTLDPSQPVTYPIRGEYSEPDNALYVYGLCGFTPRIKFDIDKENNTVCAINQLVSWAVMPADEDNGLPEETFECYATDFSQPEGSYIVEGILGQDSQTGNNTILLPGPWGDVCEVGSLSAFEESSLTFDFRFHETGNIINMTTDTQSFTTEYYNLQGIRVDEPSSGIYIRRQGSKVSTVMIK